MSYFEIAYIFHASVPPFNCFQSVKTHVVCTAQSSISRSLKSCDLLKIWSER